MLQFDLITPEKKLISDQFDMVVVPGKEGDFGVLEGHMPLISRVRPGVLEIYKGEQVIDSIFIYGGFAEANNEKLTVLAQDAVKVLEINLDEIHARMRVAREALHQLEEGSPDRASHEAFIQTAEMMIAVKENYK